jgi:hypothetical protein
VGTLSAAAISALSENCGTAIAACRFRRSEGKMTPPLTKEVPLAAGEKIPPLDSLRMTRACSTKHWQKPSRQRSDIARI